VLEHKSTVWRAADEAQGNKIEACLLVSEIVHHDVLQMEAWLLVASVGRVSTPWSVASGCGPWARSCWGCLLGVSYWGAGAPGADSFVCSFLVAAWAVGWVRWQWLPVGSVGAQPESVPEAEPVPVLVLVRVCVRVCVCVRVRVRRCQLAASESLTPVPVGSAEWHSRRWADGMLQWRECSRGFHHVCGGRW
jgi:hypothetical protein